MVDFGEFVNMMINQNNNTLDEKELLEAFRTFDGDDKGYIFSNEIRYVMRHMGESIPEQDINEILQDHQESRKRKITFEGNCKMLVCMIACAIVLVSEVGPIANNHPNLVQPAPVLTVLAIMSCDTFINARKKCICFMSSKNNCHRGVQSSPLPPPPPQTLGTFSKPRRQRQRQRGTR